MVYRMNLLSVFVVSFFLFRGKGFICIEKSSNVYLGWCVYVINYIFILYLVEMFSKYKKRVNIFNWSFYIIDIRGYWELRLFFVVKDVLLV